jgi:hypothetical protein
MLFMVLQRGIAIRLTVFQRLKKKNNFDILLKKYILEPIFSS